MPTLVTLLVTGGLVGLLGWVAFVGSDGVAAQPIGRRAGVASAAVTVPAFLVLQAANVPWPIALVALAALAVGTGLAVQRLHDGRVPG